MEKYIFIGFGLLVSYVLLRRFLVNKKTKEYDALYNHIITSEKYKAKGQFD